jgi:hypothetical protein
MQSNEIVDKSHFFATPFACNGDDGSAAASFECIAEQRSEKRRNVRGCCRRQERNDIVMTLCPAAPQLQVIGPLFLAGFASVSSRQLGRHITCFALGRRAQLEKEKRTQMRQ